MERNMFKLAYKKIKYSDKSVNHHTTFKFQPDYKNLKKNKLRRGQDVLRRKNEILI